MCIRRKSAFGLAMTLTLPSDPANFFQQRPLIIWWIFISSFIEIPSYRDTASREIGVNVQRTNEWTPDGRPYCWRRRYKYLQHIKEVIISMCPSGSASATVSHPTSNSAEIKSTTSTWADDIDSPNRTSSWPVLRPCTCRVRECKLLQRPYVYMSVVVCCCLSVCMGLATWNKLTHWLIDWLIIIVWLVFNIIFLGQSVW